MIIHGGKKRQTDYLYLVENSWKYIMINFQETYPQSLLLFSGGDYVQKNSTTNKSWVKRKNSVCSVFANSTKLLNFSRWLTITTMAFVPMKIAFWEHDSPENRKLVIHNFKIHNSRIKSEYASVTIYFKLNSVMGVMYIFVPWINSTWYLNYNIIQDML